MQEVKTNYKVSGLERKWLKKDLAKLKYRDKMFWFYEDINDVYGCGLSTEEAQKRKKELETEITNIQQQLNQTV